MSNQHTFNLSSTHRKAFQRTDMSERSSWSPADLNLPMRTSSGWTPTLSSTPRRKVPAAAGVTTVLLSRPRLLNQLSSQHAGQT